MRVSHVGGRVVLVLVGALLSSACYALTIRAGLGLGPLYVFQDGLARQLGISIGQSVAIVGVALVLVALAVRWRPGPATIALPFVSGAMLDALLPHVHPIHSVPLQLGSVLAATWLMALGGALMMRARIGFAAYDGIMLGLHHLLGQPLAPIRLAMEAIALVVGCILGGAAGVGTVITGILIGPALQFWLRRVGGDVARATAPRVRLRPGFARSRGA